MKYSLNREEMQELMNGIQEIEEEICLRIQESGIIKRKRAIKGPEILYHAAFAYITQRMSLTELSGYMAQRYDIFISHTSWGKWLKKVAPVLLEFADDLVQQNQADIPGKPEFAIDATRFSMEGHGEVARVHSVVQIDTGIAIQTLLTDEKTAETAQHVNVEKGGLYIADRGYGHAKDIAHILEHHADCIVRISPSHIRLYKDETCKEKIKVSELLLGDQICQTCWCQYDNKTYQVRLIGQLLPPEKQEEAQARSEKNASRKQHQIKPATRLYAKWVLVVTSLWEMPVQEVLDRYRKRWQIELFFKRGKSILNFHRLRLSNLSYRTVVLQLWLFAVKICSTAIVRFLHLHSDNFSLYSLFRIAKFAFA